MKIALVHDWLAETRGGAEELLLRIAELYPSADIFCLTYNKKIYPELANRQVTTSWLGKLPGFIRRHRSWLLIFAPGAIERLRLAEYDLIISVSNSFAKGAQKGEQAVHVAYCQAPMRYVWDYWPQQVNERAKNAISKAYIHWLTHRLRLWDYYSAQAVDAWIANSQTTAERIQKYYRQPSVVVYPGIVDTARFWDPLVEKQDFYVTLATLAPYKRLDLAISACKQTKRQLAIIGDGPDRARLEELADGSPYIKFMGRLSEEAKIHLLQGAKGLIFPSEEDFGIAPIEAMAAGTPVIAYGKGGLTETVVDGQTGVFFYDQTAGGLARALDKFESVRWNPKTCHEHAQHYSLTRFKQQFTKAITKLSGKQS